MDNCNQVASIARPGHPVGMWTLIALKGIRHSFIISFIGSNKYKIL